VVTRAKRQSERPLQPPKTSTRPGGAAEAPRDSSLEDDLDEADFFIQQSLFDEARGMLESLLSRYPNHPLVNAKLRDMTELERAAAGAPAPAAGAPLKEVNAELSAQLPVDLPGSGEIEMPKDSVAEPVSEVTRRGVIEKGVTAEDYETHYDLGIAYKEMGLIDDAIAEFRTVMKDPPREVQCHLMVGLCYVEKNMVTDAIGQFKKGLYVEGITDRESLSLYFELGQAYEKLGDPREALYYYDKVQKRDPRFREVERRITRLRGADPGVSAVPTVAPKSDDVDAAFESLLGEDTG
jgi:tetratricopeptide (TPR) repeat protein